MASMRPNHAKRTNLYAVSKEKMAAQLKAESADYAAAQKPERNQGFLHSGVNQVMYNSYNIRNKPTAVGNRLVN